MDIALNYNPLTTLKKVGLIFVFGGISAVLTHFDPTGTTVGIGFLVGLKNFLTHALGIEF